MRSRRFLTAVALIAVFLPAPGRPAVFAAAADVPARLTDQEFWKLSQDLSEPDGTFSSDNLLSNEVVFGRLVPGLMAHVKPGGVYLGVGPEQNFTYIAATKPRMAFITDIRRGNLHVQLMYKALFELSKDRAEFVSRLFTKPRPANLTGSSTVREIMDGYWDALSADETAFQANLSAVHTLLTKTHRIPLEQTDLDGVASVYRAFYWYGPAITWSARTALTSPAGPPRSGNGTYWGMMTQTDEAGEAFGYLASEDKFNVVKDLEIRNLIVPVVGDFSGPRALRAVGTYVKDHGATVSAFYLSNVESYLTRAGTWPAFCANVATFPVDDASVLIRPSAVPRVAASATGQFSVVVPQNNGTSMTVPVQGTGTVMVNGQAVTYTVLPSVAISNTGTPMNSGSLVPQRSGPALSAATAPAGPGLAGLIPIRAEAAACSGK